jgi:hypothetical protein
LCFINVAIIERAIQRRALTNFLADCPDRVLMIEVRIKVCKSWRWRTNHRPPLVANNKNFAINLNDFKLDFLSNQRR